MRIGERTIGDGCPPLIIAEIGVNHDGSAEQALALTEAAARAGADAVKVQFFRADLLMSRAGALAQYQRDAGERDPINMLRRLELDARALAAIASRARALGLACIATVFSTPLVPEAESVGFDAYKTASPDIIHRPLIESLARTGRPLILSTGAADLGEIERAVSWSAGAPLALLQCVSAYPTPDAEASIGALAQIRRRTGRPTGYSDHTERVETGMIAVSAGACILEKHLTLDRRAKGPDHASSLDPAQFAEYARLARLAFTMLGSGHKSVGAVERDVRSVSRQSIVTTRALGAGRTLAPGDLCVKRPGTGLEPWRLSEVVGRPLARAVEADAPLHADDLS
ncbi:MAG TPA: N-acetylneuraminate synthase [Phycisphaerales bacterium]|nr:N-acetylneuraminate synthase [Phycisphaerales bacterium]